MRKYAKEMKLDEAVERAVGESIKFENIETKFQKRAGAGDEKVSCTHFFCG